MLENLLPDLIRAGATLGAALLTGVLGYFFGKSQAKQGILAERQINALHDIHSRASSVYNDFVFWSGACLEELAEVKTSTPREVLVPLHKMIDQGKRLDKEVWGLLGSYYGSKLYLELKTREKIEAFRHELIENFVDLSSDLNFRRISMEVMSELEDNEENAEVAALNVSFVDSVVISVHERVTNDQSELTASFRDLEATIERAIGVRPWWRRFR